MQVEMIRPNFSVTNCTTWKYVSMWGQTRGQNFTPLINCRIFPRQVVASAWYHHSFLIFLFPFVEILRISKFQKYVYSFILKYFVHKFLMKEFFIDFLFSTSIKRCNVLVILIVKYVLCHILAYILKKWNKVRLGVIIGVIRKQWK